MKKLVITALLFVFYIAGYGARIISYWDIARWYLDADLVVVGHVTNVKTIIVHKVDSVDFEGFRNKFEVIKEKYTLSIDSVLRGNPTLKGNLEAFTPTFLSNFSRDKETKEFEGLNTSGDSIFIRRIEVPDYENYDDNAYFRLPSDGKCIVILKRNKSDYEIVYQQHYKKDFLSFLNDVKTKGENYFLPAKELK
jgi:hypothetical protein